jgi:hypothetical protein
VTTSACPWLNASNGFEKSCRPPSALLCVGHVVGTGVDLFEAACRSGLEGIVAKRADGRYTPDEPKWAKIKNRNYSQIEGRRELFEKRRPAELMLRAIPWLRRSQAPGIRCPARLRLVSQLHCGSENTMSKSCGRFLARTPLGLLGAAAGLAKRRSPAEILPPQGRRLPRQ